MKYVLSFLAGMLCAIFVFPPQPTIEVDKMTRKQIAYEVIEYLEEEEFDSIAAKRAIVKGKDSWF